MRKVIVTGALLLMVCGTISAQEKTNAPALKEESDTLKKNPAERQRNPVRAEKVPAEKEVKSELNDPQKKAVLKPGDVTLTKSQEEEKGARKKTEQPTK